MRKVRVLLGATALGIGIMVTATAAPAQADSIKHAWFSEGACIYGGNMGIQAGWWTTYRCVHGNEQNPNLWFLYA
ncbi:hypothetical protein Acor_36850 [Acrocarpospora corrugata]|uniref:Chitin-binding type-3 domain-containing protein n=1 Tax=Acrocarpospora corrugata TaxID=35763 RepID=A0A5M3W3A4_9ACTN|nr:hypothetical protein [Acrocarpospora corrugata]GES01621.1 hypothetical protein Acor_36850 [Acrocarpospora corrugata]